MSEPIAAPIESVLLGELADVEPDGIAVAGLDVVTTEGRHLLTAATPALRDMAAAWLVSALTVRNEWREEQRERQSGLVPLGEVVARELRDEGEPR